MLSLINYYFRLRALAHKVRIFQGMRNQTESIEIMKSLSE